MAEKIQRIPAGLGPALAISGGVNPKVLADQVVPTLELLQFFALSQRATLLTNNPALALLGNVTAVTPNAWSVLLAANATALTTATQTALALRVSLQRATSGNFQTYAFGESQTFGAGKAGGTFDVPYAPGALILLPPISSIRCVLAQLGVDAAANVTITAEIGLLG